MEAERDAEVEQDDQELLSSNEGLMRFPQMLLIGLDGKSLGVVSFEFAWDLAQKQESDILLVKVCSLCRLVASDQASLLTRRPFPGRRHSSCSSSAT